MSRRDRDLMDALRLFRDHTHHPAEFATAAALRMCGYQQREIAERLGVSQQTVSRWGHQMRKLVDEAGWGRILASVLRIVDAELVEVEP